MTTAMAAAGCGGDSCDARLPWPLHHVRHRGSFRRLCTSCVLKSHPGSFCYSCFAVLDQDPPPLSSSSAAAGAPAGTAAAAPRPAVAHCSKCSSVSHLACLENPDLAAQFVCPSCRNPDGFSYFPPARPGDESKRFFLDLESAKVLLAAAKIAAASMGRAATAARLEAERKVKEAVVARKRAREMIERVIVVAKKEKAAKEVSGVGGEKGAASPIPEVIDPRKRVVKQNVSSAEMAQKRMQSREREKLLKFNEPIGRAVGPAQGVTEDDKSNAKKNLQNHVDQEKDRDSKGGVSGLQSASIKKE